MCLAAICLVSLGAAAQDLPEETNLVENPGFEDLDANGRPAGWQADPAVYSVVESPAHSGSRALQYENTDAGRYVLCSCPVPFEVDRAFEVSGWVKTENIVGDDTGATLCIQWYDADTKWLGGHFPAGFKGTTDWQQLHSISGRVPEGAASCEVVCYVRQRMTGKAWFDDIELKLWREPPLTTLLTRPNYRGILRPGETDVEVQAELRLPDWGLAPADVVLRGWFVDGDGDRHGHVVEAAPAEASASVTLDASDLKPGAYEAVTELSPVEGGEAIATDRWRIRVPGKDAPPGTCTIDEHNRLLVNDEPFFPLGMYFGSVKEDELRLYAESPFNCLMPYGAPTQEQMDLAQSLGLKVIYSVKDAYFGSTWCPEPIKSVDDERPFVEAAVSKFRDHPALLAWYLNDELSPEYADRLQQHQAWIEELDPNHPTWVVLYQVDQLGSYLRTFDAIGTDPYPIPTRPASVAGEWARKTVRAVRDARPVWMVPQVHNWAVYETTEEGKAGKRPPTVEEMRCMAWQCIAEGAGGLVFYSFFDLQRDPAAPFEARWADMTTVAREIKEQTPNLLSVEPVPLLDVAAQPWLSWTTRQVGTDTFLYLVNSGTEEHSLAVGLPRRALSVQAVLGDAPEQSDVGEVAATLPPLAVKVYRVKLAGAPE